MNTAGGYAEQDNPLAAMRALQDLVRDAGKRATDLLRSEHRLPARIFRLGQAAWIAGTSRAWGATAPGTTAWGATACGTTACGTA